ncbi:MULTISPECIES: branched-chain amino acid ABC transporter substrate-binding protein [unclassified Meiothermus]|uniref:branched-chain amino acid ABC transporter substrate-binding protein n=1 Tax=unclassified Meiothermus TaxID=370471 RepID=UPI000D7CCEC6|nr:MULTISPECIES: branched-chain amino acid ABC transporter substrate-binding protein [unclassified Meiothermus]PZA07945.1 branched-chain amino acid ABC transporter substrate-binding protein [Meiothermus sp. Pnk-1]RYM36710.1 branched-chain amino acid ABC transporter substrate-binding protein [Meiothermus sp. PNK-Is4]
MNKSKALLVTGMALLGSALAQTTLKIGFVSPLSGELAPYGEPAKNGAQIAVEQAQARFAKLGFKLELSVQDDQANPDTSVAVARRLINDPDVLGVVGPLTSGTAIPASVAFKEGNLAMVVPVASNPTLTERGLKNVFRVYGRDDVQGPAGAEYAVKTLGVKRVFVVHDKGAYGQGVAQAFAERAKALGAQVIAVVGTEEKVNFQPLVAQMQAAKPDLVYFGGYHDRAAPLLTQMRQRGVTALFMGPDGFDNSEFVRLAGAATKGIYYTSPAGPASQYPSAKPFVEAYKAKFGKEPEPFALFGYDSAQVIIAGLEAAIRANGGQKPSREQVVQAISKVKLNGATGEIAFDAKGDRTLARYFIIQLKDGTFPGVVLKSVAVGAAK